MQISFAMKRLFVSSKVESRIESLEKTGKAGQVLARKVTGIIDRLVCGDFRNHMDALKSYTKYGENRIKNCRKYDLGCGFRLIMLQRGKTVFIPFLGSHDECQRWLENNSRMKRFSPGNGTTIPIKASRTPEPDQGDIDHLDTAEDGTQLTQNLTDSDLRTVFCGIVEGAGKKL